ncbi:MAG: hypothetical protein RL145_1554 [Pseudomonadota bacterium]|jgi:SulP family sulfate permease
MTEAAPDPTRVFKPKLISVLREGYDLRAFGKDSLAGATVAVVALPLSMAIAIACGLPPEKGLITAIVGGLIVSASGGSRYQIGGPAGAFIVPVAGTVLAHGVAGLITATFLSGIFLLLAGALRLGRFVRLIPKAVVLGFSAGIAIIIAASQLHDFLGLQISHEPAELAEKIRTLISARASFNPAACALAIATMAVILLARRWKPAFPGMLLAIVVTSLAAEYFHLPIETLGDRFSTLKGVWPAASLPQLDPAFTMQLLPAAASFALLGAIESLLSATVGDTMGGRQHRPEAELVAQGLANMGAALFGGFCVTGTIARTATNIRAGAHGPIAGILHAVFVLIAFLALMPLAAHIPFAALAGVLMVVAWGMIERHEIASVVKSSFGQAAAMLVTLLIVAWFDLTAGIAAGCALVAISTWVKRSKPPPA